MRQVIIAADQEPAPILDDIIDLADEAQVDIREIPRGRFYQMAATDAPQGVVAMAAPLREYAIEELLQADEPSPAVQAPDAAQESERAEGPEPDSGDADSAREDRLAELAAELKLDRNRAGDSADTPAEPSEPGDSGAATDEPELASADTASTEDSAESNGDDIDAADANADDGANQPTELSGDDVDPASADADSTDAAATDDSADSDGGGAEQPTELSGDDGDPASADADDTAGPDDPDNAEAADTEVAPVAGLSIRERESEGDGETEAGPGGAVDAPPLLLVVDGVTDPGNLGAILRTAECAGVTGVILPRHRAARITPTVTKRAAGAIEHLRFAPVSGIPTALATLAEQGVWSVGLDVTADRTIWELDLADAPLAIVLGAEGRGLSHLVRQRCDMTARIPVTGRLDALNVAAATAVTLFEVLRRRLPTT